MSRRQSAEEWPLLAQSRILAVEDVSLRGNRAVVRCRPIGCDHTHVLNAMKSRSDARASSNAGSQERRGGHVKHATLDKAGQKKLEQAMRLWPQAQQRFEKIFGANKPASLRAVLSELSSENFREAYLGRS